MALKSIQVLEIAGLAPGPFCGMILNNFGAKVIQIDKLNGMSGTINQVNHGKLSLSLNMKHPEGVKIFKHLASTSDVIIDPFRAGVMEKLELGPEHLQNLNEKLIYARLTGYGQDGPLAQKAGHDINFLSISGVLSTLGWTNKAPSPPNNLLADFGGGGLMCALGIIVALFEREKSGKGQVVDCSMTRGVSYLASWLMRTQNSFLWSKERGNNILDGGSFFYDTFQTKDGKWMAVGALEEKFYNNLLVGLGLNEEELPQYTPVEEGRKILTERFMEHNQEHWVKVFSDIDACVTPVLSVEEAVNHEHNVLQKSFSRSTDGCIVPSVEPRLNRTPGKTQLYRDSPQCGEHTFQILKEAGYTVDEIKSFKENNIIQMKIVSKI